MRLKSYSAQTHQGPYLQINEDGYDFDFENNLYLVLDGIGGSGIGDRCVEMLKDDIKRQFTKMSHDPNSTMPFFYDSKNILEANAILNSLLHCHKKIFSQNLEKEIGLRGAASLIAAVKSENLMVVIGVGNCNAFLFRRGLLTKIIQEDSFKFHSRDKFDSPQVNFPMNALGMYPEMTFLQREIRLSEGDRIILMTDGIYPHLTHEELSFTLAKNNNDDAEIINTLLKLSNSRGNKDNQTVMILGF